MRKRSGTVPCSLGGRQGIIYAYAKKYKEPQPRFGSKSSHVIRTSSIRISMWNIRPLSRRLMVFRFWFAYGDRRLAIHRSKRVREAKRDREISLAVPRNKLRSCAQIALDYYADEMTDNETRIFPHERNTVNRCYAYLATPIKRIARISVGEISK